MSRKIRFQNIGRVSFDEGWKIQQNIQGELIELKLANKSQPVCNQVDAVNHLLFCEHYPVFTIGKSGSDSNLLINKDIMEEKGVSLFHIDRGGDITYHGPGQIVGYPIFDLECFSIGVKEYIFKLEQSVINTLKHYQIEAGRLSGATGVWLEPEGRNARKICAIGVKVSRSVSMHGFAFNVNTDLSYFDLINPCGFTDKTVTSLEKETGMNVDQREVEILLLEQILKQFESVLLE
jgi:lipoyl(octanoyl) transferase